MIVKINNARKISWCEHVSGSPPAMSVEEKLDADARSIFVGNVRPASYAFLHIVRHLIDIQFEAMLAFVQISCFLSFCELFVF